MIVTSEELTSLQHHLVALGPRGVGGYSEDVPVLLPVRRYLGLPGWRVVLEIQCCEEYGARGGGSLQGAASRFEMRRKGMAGSHA